MLRKGCIHCLWHCCLTPEVVSATQSRAGISRVSTSLNESQHYRCSVLLYILTVWKSLDWHWFMPNLLPTYSSINNLDPQLGPPGSFRASDSAEPIPRIPRIPRIPGPMPPNSQVILSFYLINSVSSTFTPPHALPSSSPSRFQIFQFSPSTFFWLFTNPWDSSLHHLARNYKSCRFKLRSLWFLQVSVALCASNPWKEESQDEFDLSLTIVYFCMCPLVERCCN